jgi:two-component sensor histidine kinase
MVHLTQAGTVEDLKTAIEGRLHALAKVHTLLVESRWVGADLRTLTTQELAPYCPDVDARTRIDGANLLLEPDKAQAIAVTIHELTTNATKYGALSTDEGRIRVTFSRVEDRLLLLWTEADGPPVTPPTRRGFGTRVIESMIRQSNGEIRFEWRAQGLTCEVSIPL